MVSSAASDVYKRQAKHLWEVEQVLLGPGGEVSGSIRGWVDLREDQAPAGVLIEMEALDF